MPLIKKDIDATVLQPADPAGLLSRLRNGPADDRRLAARSLSQIAMAAPALGEALLLEGDDRVRETIFTSLAILNSTEGVQAVLPLLRSDDATLRTGALDALKAMPGPVADFIESLLRDSDPDVRILACDLARDVRAPTVAPALAQLLETDTILNVCAAAIDTLAEIGTAAELPALARCLARFPEEPFLAFSIQTASARIASGH